MPLKPVGVVGAGRGLMTMSRRSPFLMGAVKTTGRRVTKVETLTRPVAGGGAEPPAGRASFAGGPFFFGNPLIRRAHPLNPLPPQSPFPPFFF